MEAPSPRVVRFRDERDRAIGHRASRAVDPIVFHSHLGNAGGFLGLRDLCTCGQSRVPLLDLFTFGFNIENFGHAIGCLEQERLKRDNKSVLLIPQAAAKIMRFWITKKRIKVDALNWYLGDLKCEDIRDRIFGLVHVIDWYGARPITPDYSMNPVEIVFGIVSSDYLNLASRHFYEPCRSIASLLEWLNVEASQYPIDENLRHRRAGQKWLPSKWSSAMSRLQPRVLFYTDRFVRISSSLAADSSTSKCYALRYDPGNMLESLAATKQQYLQLVDSRYEHSSSQQLGYFPASSQCGDILAFTQWLGDRTALILREEVETGILCIIGQAIFTGIALVISANSGSPRPWDDFWSRKGVQGQASLVMHFDLLDCILWVCQCFGQNA